MDICMIGHCGHHGRIFQNGHRLVAYAPGCPQEDMRSIRQIAEADARSYGDFRDMLRAERPSLVVVNPWFGYTADVSVQCLLAGADVFSEKPLAGTLAALDTLQATVGQTGQRFGSMLPGRHEPWIQTMMRSFRHGDIGSIRLIHAQKSYKLGTREDFFKRREDFTGLIPWVAIHAIDWALYFGGPCHAVHALHTTRENRGMASMEMSAALLIRQQDDVFTTISADYLRPAGAARHDDDRLRLTGTRGVLEYRDQAVTLVNEHGQQTLPLMERGDAFEDFLRRREDGSWKPLAQSAFDATRVALIARDTADQAEGHAQAEPDGRG